MVSSTSFVRPSCSLCLRARSPFGIFVVLIADLGIAFVAGLLSCASACVLPLLPAYLAYVGGLGQAGGGRLAVLGGAGLFVAGFGTAFVTLGAGAALVGASLAGYRPALVTASGVVLVVLGAALLVSVP